MDADEDANTIQSLTAILKQRLSSLQTKKEALEHVSMSIGVPGREWEVELRSMVTDTLMDLQGKSCTGSFSSFLSNEEAQLEL